MKQKYTVTVGGIELNLLSEETEEYVVGLAKLVDQRINNMVISSKRCTKTEAALVCAMDYLDDKLKTALTLENLQKQRDSYLREIEALKKENNELKKQLQ